MAALLPQRDIYLTINNNKKEQSWNRKVAAHRGRATIPLIPFPTTLVLVCFLLPRDSAWSPLASPFLFPPSRADTNKQRAFGARQPRRPRCHRCTWLWCTARQQQTNKSFSVSGSLSRPLVSPRVKLSVGGKGEEEGGGGGLGCSIMLTKEV